MRTISDLVSRTYHYSSSTNALHAVHARVISKTALQDYVVDWQAEANHRLVEPHNTLEPGDVLLGYTGPLEKDIVAVGIYHPENVSEEPLTVSPCMIALRPASYEDGLLLLAHLLPYVNRRHCTHWAVVKALEVTEIPGGDLRIFCSVLLKVHKLRRLQRQTAKNLAELIPAVAYNLAKKARK